MTQHVNLDYYAGTPVLSEAKQAMEAALDEFGNPSSIHQAGQRSKRVLEQARKQVAGLLDAKSSEIFFTSCKTESNKWALRGLTAANTPPGRRRVAGQERKAKHLIFSVIEHPSISLAAAGSVGVRL